MTPNVSVDEIIAYESDEMTEEEEIAFFQKLINNGQAWTLQGHYGRQAIRFIDAGLCSPPPNRVQNSPE
jgi:hypothetical protein